jgi:hypothetical protein
VTNKEAGGNSLRGFEQVAGSNPWRILGSKEKLWFAQTYIVIDSDEDAKRFGTAFTHAIKLRGGEPAPF